MEEQKYVVDSAGNKHKACMGILCYEDKCETCYFHKVWECTRSVGGVWFGSYDCTQHQPINED